MQAGLDSHGAVALADMLAAAFKMTALQPSSLVFDHPTISALASYIIKLWRVRSKPQIEVPPPPYPCSCQLYSLTWNGN